MWRRRLGAAGRWGLLTLTVTLVVGWPLSKWWALFVMVTDGRFVSVASGCVSLDISPGPHSPVWHRLPLFHVVENPIGRELGFVWSFDRSRTQLRDSIRIPLWSIVPIPVVLTGAVWRGRVQAAFRRRRGACVSCGYDRGGLTATVACPECGSPQSPP